MDGQNAQYPLYTELDSLDLAPYQGVFKFSEFSLEKCFAYRGFLKPYADKKDPRALMEIARTHDLFPFGIGDSINARVAIAYYQEAADLNYAEAEYFMAGLYRYGFMNAPVDPEKVIYYSKRAFQHGDSLRKAKILRDFAQMAAPNTKAYPGIPQNRDSCIAYLEKSLALAPGDTWSLDYLGSLYAKKGDYEKAMAVYLQSDNQNSQLKVIKWLIKGENIPRDRARGLALLYPLVAAADPKPQGFFSDNHPLWVINYLYYCDKALTKKQIGKYRLENFRCGS